MGVRRYRGVGDVVSEGVWLERPLMLGDLVIDSDV